MSAETGHLLVCPECDLLYSAGRLAQHEVARCRRCAAVVQHGPRGSFDLSLSLLFTALVLFLLATSYPLLTLKLQGQVETVSLISAGLALAEAGLWPLAAVVVLTTIVAPALEIGGLIYVLAPLRWSVGRREGQAPGAAAVFRWLEVLRPWGMIEVYLLGVLVAMVKLSSLASIEPGPALFAFGLLVFVTAGALVSLDAQAIWRCLGPR